MLKDKVENNEPFTRNDCGIFDFIPAMKFERKMDEVIFELVEVLSKATVPEEYNLN